MVSWHRQLSCRITLTQSHSLPLHSYQMLTSIAALSLAFLSPLVSATVIPSLPKRDQQVLYLTNCFRALVADGNDKYQASYGAWYASNDNSQTYQNPDALTNEYRNWANGGTFLNWEQQQQTITFPGSGTSVTTSIQPYAYQYSTGSYAGEAWRSDGYHFSCFKDHDRSLFEELAPNVPDHSNRNLWCWAVYYCF